MIGTATFAEMLGQNIQYFMPWRIVHDYEQGVRFKKGAIVETIKTAGWYWFLPLRDKIEVVPTVWRGVDLPSISVMLEQEGKYEPVTIAGKMGFEIYDAGLLYKTTDSTRESLENITVSTIARTLREYDLPHVYRHTRTLENKITTLVNKEVNGRGIKVTDIALSTLVSAHQYKIFGDDIAKCLETFQS